jgi:hypothetical protein
VAAVLKEKGQKPPENHKQNRCDVGSFQIRRSSGEPGKGNGKDAAIHPLAEKGRKKNITALTSNNPKTRARK